MKRYWPLLFTLLLVGCDKPSSPVASVSKVRDSARIDAVVAQLFPPNVVMRHQREIELTDEQRSAIQREVEQTQQGMSRLSWELAAAHERLIATLSGATVDERQAAELADAVMVLEAQVKRTHLTMLIRIKNQLRPEQQRRLRELR